MAVVTFPIPGGPGVAVTIEDIPGGDLRFTVVVGNAGGQTADLRALFFHLNNFASFTGLTVTGGPVVTDRQIAGNGVIDLGNGANLQGEATPSTSGSSSAGRASVRATTSRPQRSSCPPSNPCR